MKDYREKDVDGLITDITQFVIPKKCNVTVRMTSDKIGQSLSLSAYNIMISIPLEQVRDIIKVSERGSK
jgi:hypothetical protein